MSCGLIRLVSRIKMAWWVMRHPEFHCKPACLTCEFFDECWNIHNTIETVFGEPFE